MEVRVGDVGGAWTPLVGSYQRFGFNQPGPLLLYVLAVPYRLMGRRYVGMELGAVAVGALSVACVLRVAWRRGGRVGSLWAAALLGVVVAGVRAGGVGGSRGTPVVAAGAGGRFVPAG